MCSKDRLLEERVEGAETLAYLIETDVELQRMASITDHLIVMLADYFKYPSSVSAITDIKRVRSLPCSGPWRNGQNQKETSSGWGFLILIKPGVVAGPHLLPHSIGSMVQKAWKTLYC